MYESFAFPDTTVMLNFAAVGRLSLLEEYVSGRGRVVEAVVAEIRDWTGRYPALAETSRWLQEPIRIEGDGPTRAVQLIRIGRFGGTATKPREHLGESETIYVLQNDSSFGLSVLLTDDHDAYRVAGALGLLRGSTVEVLQALVQRGELTPAEAYGLCLSMAERDRTLIGFPASLRAFA